VLLLLNPSFLLTFAPIVDMKGRHTLMSLAKTFQNLFLHAAMLMVCVVGSAQTLTGAKLVQALRHGGYVIVMRHASSPQAPPAKDAANPDNPGDERQLDERGITTATSMGKTIRSLDIPIGEVLSSPTYRALETIRYAKLGEPHVVAELGENGKSMQASSAGQAEWLRHRVTVFPKRTNTLLVTHYPNLTAAFPKEAAGLQDGEALVFGPDGAGGATLVARIKIEDWLRLQP
jgi:phosphohistidine phosphatase SixA